MEIKNIHEHSGWFSSYMCAPDGGNDAQGKALVECQEKKIKQLIELVDKINGEIELTEEPKEYDEKVILESIKTLISQVQEVEASCGNFKWIG